MTKLSLTQPQKATVKTSLDVTTVNGYVETRHGASLHGNVISGKSFIINKIKDETLDIRLMTPNPDNQPTTTEQTPPTPLRCLTSALISGSLAIAGYWLTTSIAQTLASKPLPSGNVTAMNIAIAVRTLVVGISTLATAVFSLVAVGLVALAIQLSVQRFTQGTK